ncbi:MAG: LLM class flavin-dependent oxidoreductase [Armatimonadetes bacterium]|nr:LLM class flavin-dependent oxidoreductase [Armatimonadota bacterium]
MEFAWFAPCCEDDCELLGVPDPALASTPEHVREVIRAAERTGFQNILLPSGFNTGVDSWTTAAAVAYETHTLSLLPAVRVGESHVPMFARAAANLDRMLGGRLNVNIISSPIVGLPPEPSAVRYGRTREFMHLLKAFWTQEHVTFAGEYFQFDLKADLPRPVQPGGPPLYFGGASPEAKRAAAAEADVYLFWGDTVLAIRAGIVEMRALAAEQGRTLVYGLRVHVIARPTEEDARAAADRLVSRLSADVGETIKQRALDRESVGKARQNELLAQGDWADTSLWTGIGRGRGGCGTAIVGSYDQVEAKLREYMNAGVRAFILSGYPHGPEAARFGQHLLHRFARTTCREMLGREG